VELLNRLGRLEVVLSHNRHGRLNLHRQGAEHGHLKQR
jgi:hypothetical protein